MDSSDTPLAEKSPPAPSRRWVSVVLTGDVAHPEFRSARDPDSLYCVTTADWDQLADIATEGRPIDLLAIAQARSGQLPEQHVSRLLDLFPLTPIVAVLGSWCEGFQRMGAPWPGCLYVYWYQWRPAIRRFADQMIRLGISDWHQPRTIDRRSLSEQITVPSDSVEARVGVSASSLEEFQPIADALQSFGCQVNWLDLPEPRISNPVDLVFVAGESWSGKLALRIQELKKAHGSVPIGVAISYPRLDEVESCELAGIEMVFAKPLDLLQLYTWLRMITATRDNGEPA